MEYESHMRLLELWGPQAVLGGEEKAKEECVIAMIESTVDTHEFITIMEVTQQRQIPQNLQVNINLNLQTPDPDFSTEEFLSQLQPVIQERALVAVREALMAQAPPTGIEISARQLGWHQRNDRNS